MKTQSNYQDLLKLLAIITMIIDHFGLYFYPEQLIIRAIGRSAMPIFCFFAGYNSHKYPKHQILILGIVLYVISTIIFGEFSTANILISIYLGQLYIFLFHKQLNKISNCYLHLIFTVALFPYTMLLFEYGSIIIAIMILGYIAKHQPRLSNLLVSGTIILSMFHTFIIFMPATTYITTIIILIALGEYLLITARDFNQPINFNIRIISRNTLLIYFIQVIILQLIYSTQIITPKHLTNLNLQYMLAAKFVII